MMEKERLEKIKSEWNGDDILCVDDINWLIEQAERVQALEIYVDENSKKHANLNVFLQERNTTSTLGKHVVDATMQYVQELEDIIYQDERQEVLESIYEENKRYREALYAIEDFDIELGDSRDDMKNKLSQIKFIKDEALEDSK